MVLRLIMRSCFLFMLIFWIGISNTYSQNCTHCAIVINTDPPEDVHVDMGQNVCIRPGVQCGNVFVSGGTLCNEGTIQNLILSGEASEINNYGDITTSNGDWNLNGSVVINNYPQAAFHIQNDVTINMQPDNLLEFNLYNQSTLDATDNITVNSGSISFRNGLAWSGNTFTAYFTAKSITVSDASFNFENSSTGDVSLSGSIDLSNMGNKIIVNDGNFSINGSLNISGDAGGAANVSIQNNLTFNITGNFVSTIENAPINIAINHTAGFSESMTIGGNLAMYSSGSLFTNNALLTAGGVLYKAGTFTNNDSISVLNDFTNQGGTFNNNRTASIKNLINLSGTTNNDGLLRIGGNFSNTGQVNFLKESDMFTQNYSNTGGRIDGPELTASEATNRYKWPGVVIYGESKNSATLDGYLVFYDKSLVATESNVGFGFDVVTNGNLIGDWIKFTTWVQPDSPPTVGKTCDSLAMQSVWATWNIHANKDTLCPGDEIDIIMDLTGHGLNAWVDPQPNYTYTLYPGGTVGQAHIAHPTVTTVYTLCAEYELCTYCDTFRIFVWPSMAASIKYITKPYYSDETVTFTVQQSGTSGGIYSIAPTNPSVTIDSLTGKITAWGNSYGTYVVSYCIPVVGSPCPPACATVQISLEDAEQIIGCCFSNYGAAVYLADSATKLNIYCNLVNEISPGDTALQSGEFYNKDGRVSVYLDWIHNAHNWLYVIRKGTTSFFGMDQKMKGVKNTRYHHLRLDGSGTKMLRISEYSSGDMDLTSNRLAIRTHTFFMRDSSTTAATAATISRTYGYAYMSINGYFSRTIQWDSGVYKTKEYLFPVGSPGDSTFPFRYRPIVMSKSYIKDEIMVNFMNVPPAIPPASNSDPVYSGAGNVITSKAPAVINVNMAYYHKIKNTVPPPAPSGLEIRSYFLQSDGQFQSLSEWKKNPNLTTDWWSTTPGSSANNNISTDPGTAGLVYAATYGKQAFTKPPFSLAFGGFYVNTTNFGNGNGTTVSLTGSPYGPGGGTPSGGGIGNTYGTGSNSGNNGQGGNTVFAPNPVAGQYVLTVTSANNCDINDKIKFVVEPSGAILPQKVEWGLAGNGPYFGQLSEELFTIDTQNSGIILKSSPSDLLKKCINDVTVKTVINNDYVFTTGDTIKVTLPTVNSPNTINFGTFKIYDIVPSPAVLVYTSGAMSSGNNFIVPPSMTAGVYSFEFTVGGNFMTTQTIKGQLIVK